MTNPSGAVHWFAFGIMVFAMVWSNFVVRRMAKLVGVDWHVKDDRASKNTIRKYRQEYGNGPLFRQFLIACGVCGIAAVVIIFER